MMTKSEAPVRTLVGACVKDTHVGSSRVFFEYAPIYVSTSIRCLEPITLALFALGLNQLVSIVP